MGDVPVGMQFWLSLLPLLARTSRFRSGSPDGTSGTLSLRWMTALRLWFPSPARGLAQIPWSPPGGAGR